MAWRKVAVPRHTIAVPAELRLGPVLELFAPEAVLDDLAGVMDVATWREARGRYEAARTAYLVSVGADPNNRHSWPVTGRRPDGQPLRFPAGKPWSLARARRDWPDQLDELLRRYDLPVDWGPDLKK